MNFYDKKFRKLISVVILVIIARNGADNGNSLFGLKRMEDNVTGKGQEKK